MEAENAMKKNGENDKRTNPFQRCRII